MTIIRRVVSAARPTVDTFFETLSTGLTNTVDTILGKSGEGRTNLCRRSSCAGCTTPPASSFFTATVN